MKILQKSLVMCALVVGLTVTASAQKDDKRPPKEKPPVVNPQPKPAPTPEPKKPKPNTSFLVWRNEAATAD
ncbi:MAG: hypothetical protein ACKVQW_05590 [Pyrinomonadaceae bacterium]